MAKLKVGIQITLWTVGSLVTVYLLAYFYQDALLFQARRLYRDHVYQFDYPYQEYFIDTRDGHQINALLFKTSQQSKGLILYFHGNADNLQRWGNYAIDFTKLGWDILMIDYRGYGKSNGVPSEKDYYTDAGDIYEWARKILEFERVVIYGRSLGSAIASHLAAEIQPNLLILETPFDEIKTAPPGILRIAFQILPLHYSFPTHQHLRNVKSRVAIFHGTNDWVVSQRSAENLRPFLKPGDEFVLVDGASHNNLRAFSIYHQKLAEILETVKQ
jgi:pimeloyl-ACP methyl ester carboxylesterase